MKKKSLALALALIMLLGVLSACGSTKPEEIGGAHARPGDPARRDRAGGYPAQRSARRRRQ